VFFGIVHFHENVKDKEEALAGQTAKKLREKRAAKP
jgi:hypothetical protein